AARKQMESAAAYLELHIEQGPVLESMGLPLGVVLGTYGVERHLVTWKGQAAHAGSTPMDKRRDALAGAAKLALEIRPIAAEVGRAGIPTVMLFVQALRGLSHTKLEDTKEEHLELAVRALDRLTTKALEAFAI